MAITHLYSCGREKIISSARFTFNHPNVWIQTIFRSYWSAPRLWRENHRQNSLEKVFIAPFGQEKLEQQVDRFNKKRDQDSVCIHALAGGLCHFKRSYKLQHSKNLQRSGCKKIWHGLIPASHLCAYFWKILRWFLIHLKCQAPSEKHVGSVDVCLIL